MRFQRYIDGTLWAGVVVAAGLAAGCSSSSAPGETLSFTAVHRSDAGAEAGCAIGRQATRVGCATAYRITGDPDVCTGFDEAGVGSTSTCEVVCSSGLACTISGLSDGTNAVDCEANCASPEH